MDEFIRKIKESKAHFASLPKEEQERRLKASATLLDRMQAEADASDPDIDENGNDISELRKQKE